MSQYSQGGSHGRNTYTLHPPTPSHIKKTEVIWANFICVLIYSVDSISDFSYDQVWWLLIIITN